MRGAAAFPRRLPSQRQTCPAWCLGVAEAEQSRGHPRHSSGAGMDHLFHGFMPQHHLRCPTRTWASLRVPPRHFFLLQSLRHLYLQSGPAVGALGGALFNSRTFAIGLRLKNPYLSERYFHRHCARRARRACPKDQRCPVRSREFPGRHGHLGERANEPLPLLLRALLLLLQNLTSNLLAS